MKLFARLAALIQGITVLMAVAHAQSLPIQPGSSWSGAGLVSIAKRPQYSACIAPPGVAFTNFLGFKGLNLDGRILTGWNLSASQGTVGYSLGIDRSINGNISFWVGGAMLYLPKGKPEPAIAAQINLKF